jgi:quercetin dioxygenase-like cupin family protein
MQQQETPNRINPADETIRVGPLSIKFLLTSADSGGSVAMFEMLARAGDKLPAPAHSHDAYEETVYGIEGVLTWTIDGNVIDVGPGESICIRRGQVHGFANNGSVDVRALAVITPALLGPEYFRDISAILSSDLDMADKRAKLGETLRRYGLTPAPPPPPAS